MFYLHLFAMSVCQIFDIWLLLNLPRNQVNLQRQGELCLSGSRLGLWHHVLFHHPRGQLSLGEYVGQGCWKTIKSSDKFTNLIIEAIDMSWYSRFFTKLEIVDNMVVIGNGPFAPLKRCWMEWLVRGMNSPSWAVAKGILVYTREYIYIYVSVCLYNYIM